MGVDLAIESLSKSFGRQNIWHDVSLTIPAGEITALLGPSGTGKSVFLKCLIGLLRPEGGRCLVAGVDMASATESHLFRARKLFGVLFQDGALFGSMTVFDNIAFPLREHTHKTEAEVRSIVNRVVDLVGLTGSEGKLPNEVSGGMRKRAGLARALVLDPQVILCDEPDSGLDPVRTSLLAQLLLDLNAQTDATVVVVTHDIRLAQTLPDNIGMFFSRRLITFGPREVVLTSDHPVISQFLDGRRTGPIGMSEEKDAAELQAERDRLPPDRLSGADVRRPLPVQLVPSAGVPVRQGAARHRADVLRHWSDLPESARAALRAHGVQPDREAQPEQVGAR